MVAKFLVLTVCFAISSAALVRREAPADASPLQDLEKNAAEFQKTFTEQFNSLANSKNTEEFNKALKEGSDSVLAQISTLSASLQAAIGDASGKAKEALEKTRSDLTKTAEELRKKHPEVEQQATQLREKLQAAVHSTVEHSQTLAKDISANIEQTNQKLGPKIKEAFDTFVKQVEEAQKKIHEAATKQ